VSGIRRLVSTVPTGTLSELSIAASAAGRLTSDGRSATPGWSPLPTAALTSPAAASASPSAPGPLGTSDPLFSFTDDGPPSTAISPSTGLPVRADRISAAVPPGSSVPASNATSASLLDDSREPAPRLR
jgi:hypothetical protein